MKRPTSDPNALIDAIAQGKDMSGVAENELLRHFYGGFPVVNLKPLLHSSDVRVRGIAIWIASELGALAKPLLPDAASALRDRHPVSRFFAIEIVLVCADRSDGATVVDVLQLLSDEDAAVRGQAIQFVRRARRELLLGALLALPATSAHAEPLRLIADVPAPTEPMIIGSIKDFAALRAWTRTGLRDISPVTRRYALAAAMRFAAIDRSLLEEAAASEHAEISTAAKKHLAITRRPDR